MLASGAGRLVLLTTSPRVAPGLLTARAWDALRAAPAVLTATPEHPQLAALAEAGVGYEVVAGTAGASGEVAGASGEVAGWDAASVAQLLAGLAAEAGAAGAAGAADGAAAGGVGDAGAEAAGAAGAPVWLAAPGGDEATGELLAALGDLPGGGPVVELLAGSRDLPGARLLDLVSVMDTLRVQCPWDAKQTHESLAPHLLEESYEALEALEEGDQAALREELGDVLLQVAFHARVAAERTDGTGYTIDDVADGIVSKLVRRHPHVFGDVEVGGADEVKQNWDAIKAAERAAKDGQPVSVLAGVPFGQPALALAAQLQRRAERSGVPSSLAAEDPLGDSGPVAPADAAGAAGDPGAVAGTGAVPLAPAGTPGAASDPGAVAGTGAVPATPAGAAAAAGGVSATGGVSAAGGVSATGGAGDERGDAGEAPDAAGSPDEDQGAMLGAELFRLVARARAAGLDPELELRAAARRYRDRVRAWEQSPPRP